MEVRGPLESSFWGSIRLKRANNDQRNKFFVVVSPIRQLKMKILNKDTVI